MYNWEKFLLDLKHLDYEEIRYFRDPDLIANAIDFKKRFIQDFSIFNYKHLFSFISNRIFYEGEPEPAILNYVEELRIAEGLSLFIQLHVRSNAHLIDKSWELLKDVIGDSRFINLSPNSLCSSLFCFSRIGIDFWEYLKQVEDASALYDMCSSILGNRCLDYLYADPRVEYIPEMIPYTVTRSLLKNKEDIIRRISNVHEGWYDSEDYPNRLTEVLSQEDFEKARRLKYSSHDKYVKAFKSDCILYFQNENYVQKILDIVLKEDKNALYSYIGFYECEDNLEIYREGNRNMIIKLPNRYSN